MGKKISSCTTYYKVNTKLLIDAIELYEKRERKRNATALCGCEFRKSWIHRI